MKIEELTQEQIEKARSLATNEERLDYLKACGVELDDDMLAEVDGGHGIYTTLNGRVCQKGPHKLKPHKWEYTNRTIKQFFGLLEFKEVRCIYCGITRKEVK
mgnify:CR=1 FL=1